MDIRNVIPVVKHCRIHNPEKMNMQQIITKQKMFHEEVYLHCQPKYTRTFSHNRTIRRKIQHDNLTICETGIHNYHNK